MYNDNKILGMENPMLLMGGYILLFTVQKSSRDSLCLFPSRDESFPIRMQSQRILKNGDELYREKRPSSALQRSKRIITDG